MLQHKSRFKHYLISPASLREESGSVAPAVAELTKLSAKYELAPAEQVLFFILIFLHQRKGDSWIMPSGKKVAPFTSQIRQGVRTSSIDSACLASFKKLKHSEFFLDIAVEFRIRLLPQAIFDVLWKWSRGDCELLLWSRVPTPFEMLDLQSQGKRIVTMDLEKAARGELVDGQRDAFEFLLHDLLHADLFFKDGQSHQQQTTFFAQLKEIILRESLLETSDPLFLKDLSYLMSDMNSHRAHLEAHFKAILIAFRLRQETLAPHESLSVQGLKWVQQVTI